MKLHGRSVCSLCKLAAGNLCIVRLFEIMEECSVRTTTWPQSSNTARIAVIDNIRIRVVAVDMESVGVDHVANFAGEAEEERH